MKKDMLGQVIRKIMDLPEEWLGVVFDLLEKLLGEAGWEWLAELKKFLCKEACWISVLKLIETVNVSMTAQKFIAKDKFIKSTERKTSVNISSMSIDFEKWFLKKTELQMMDVVLRIYKLIKSSADRLIINELGGRIKAKMMLSEMFCLIEKQGNGESGKLLVDGNVNIFYILDINEVLRAVVACWDKNGWSFGASPINDSGIFKTGCQVYSCEHTNS